MEVKDGDKKGKPSNIREGDIEAIRRSKELEGKPVRSNTIRDRDGSNYHYTIDKGRVRIVGKD